MKKQKIVDTSFKKRPMDLCCLQQNRQKGTSGRLVTGKDDVLKIFWVSSDTRSGGADIAVHQKWTDNVLEVNRVSDRIIMLKLAFQDNF